MKLSNGNTIMLDETFNATLKDIRGRFDSYQSAAEYAVFHFCEHGDKTKLERLFKAFIGASGKVIGDGAKLQQYVNKYCYGFVIKNDASVTIELKKNKKSKPRGFKAYNSNGDLTWKEGGHALGFAETVQAWMKAEETAKADKKAEAEAKQAEAEAAQAEADKTAETAKQAEAEANGDDSADDSSAASGPDFSRPGDIAEALRTMREAFASADNADIEALIEAKAEADKLAAALSDRAAKAEAETGDQTETGDEAETETNAA